MKKYGAILCDPPWKFKAYTNAVSPRAAEHHYKTSETDDIGTIPVADMTARDCAMFMWVVDSHLDQALQLFRTWGFTFKTIAFVWVKTKKHAPDEPRMGMGLWTRKEAELCLLGVKGHPPRLSGGVRQVIMEPRREHSRKPDCVYGRVEQLVGGPYLEMFARQSWPGWDAWGNEVGKFKTDAERYDEVFAA